MKIIAFSLFGNNPRYCEGAIRNALLARLIYPGWKVVIYYDDTVSIHVMRTLAGLGCEIIRSRGDYPRAMKMAWRFLACEVDGIKIFRDTDSLISPREKLCVDEWIESGKSFHAVRDHAHHYSHPLFGGLWGTTKRLPMQGWIQSRKTWGETLDDMLLLTEHVWTMAENDICQHCGMGSELQRWGEFRPIPPGDDYGIGVGVTAKW